jgi:hypothetical protein
MDKITYNDSQLKKQQTLMALQSFKAALSGVSFEEKRAESKLQILRRKLAYVFKNF